MIFVVDQPQPTIVRFYNYLFCIAIICLLDLSPSLHEVKSLLGIK